MIPKPGDLVLYNHGSGPSRLPLEDHPHSGTDFPSVVGTGPHWPDGEVGLVVEVVLGKMKWVRVLVSSGLGWCNLDEVDPFGK